MNLRFPLAFSKDYTQYEKENHRKTGYGLAGKRYARTQEFRFTLPYQFLLLCKLIEVPPPTTST